MSVRHLVSISAIILSIGGLPGLASAQQADGRDRLRDSTIERYRPSAEDLSAFTDARVAAIKAGLRLTPEQEKNWPAFEEAFRVFAKLRTDRIMAMRGAPPSPPADMMESLQRRADTAGQTATALRQIADATAPLYRSLTDAQKQRFAVLAPMLRQPGTMNFRRGHNWRNRSDNDLRGGPGSDRSPQRGMDRPRGGPMERIRLDSLDLDDSGRPGIGLARESGWH